jgi:hypothetical protein
LEVHRQQDCSIFDPEMGYETALKKKTVFRVLRAEKGEE